MTTEKYENSGSVYEECRCKEWNVNAAKNM